jgi:hypothetical protein
VTTIKIREDHENGTELDFQAAVQAALGTGRATRVVVTLVHEQDTDSGRAYGGKPITHKAGEAIFGMQAEVMARRAKYGQDEDATVSISGIASHDPVTAVARAQCYMLAAEIATTANALAGILRAPAAG